MSDTSDSSAIDEKKNEMKSSDSYYSKIINFILTVLILLILIVVYYSSSGLILYACKLSQSNILPTDIHCFPYQENKPNIQPIETNIFTTFSEPPLSMKIKFPYNEHNSSNTVLDIFREYKNSPGSNFLANYFISIVEGLISFNYSSFNTILNILNGLPEILIVLFGPIIVGIISTIILIIDHLYLIYLWFANMGWFFRTNINESGTGSPDWKDINFLDGFNYLTAVGLVFLFVILFFFSLPVLSIIASLTICWCLFSCITYKAEMYGKSITSATIIQDIFKYYKLLIMGILSFLIILSAFTKLGTVSGVFSVIILALIYFGIITIDIFKPINKDNLSPEVSYNQAKKTCSYKGFLKEKHGILYNILFGQKGGNITKELKNISKKISSK
jgi:hypothetical protein